MCIVFAQRQCFDFQTQQRHVNAFRGGAVAPVVDPGRATRLRRSCKSMANADRACEGKPKPCHLIKYFAPTVQPHSL